MSSSHKLFGKTTNCPAGRRELSLFSGLPLTARYNLSVRAAAIAHSYLKSNVVDPFCDARVNVFRGNALEPHDLPDVAMVFGGDGAVHRVLPSLAHTPTPLLIIPTGSANDFARCLGITDPAASLCAWRRYLDLGDNVRTVDLGVVRPMADATPDEIEALDSKTYADADGRLARPLQPLGPVIARQYLRYGGRDDERQRLIYFSGIAGLGLDAETNRRANRMPTWLRRHGGYALAALWALAGYVPPVVRLHSFDACGEQTILAGPVLFAAIGNAPEYGCGIKMLPKAQMDDGHLDMCFVAAMQKRAVLRNFHRIYSGTHLAVSSVQYLRSQQVFIETDVPLPLYADGEYLCQTPAEVTAAPGALRVIVP